MLKERKIHYEYVFEHKYEYNILMIAMKHGSQPIDGAGAASPDLDPCIFKFRWKTTPVPE